MNRIPFLLERPDQRPIHGQWHLPEGASKGTVLFLHGYKGYMDWGAWAMAGDMVAQHGWRMLRINFTHNGTTPDNPSAFTDLEAFAANTYRKECEEATAVLQSLRASATPMDSVATTGPLAVIGHSRGGGIACLAGAAADTALSNAGQRGVDAIITWASVCDFAARFPQGQALEEWRASGRLDILNHRTRQYLHHDWSFFQDFEDHREALTIERAVRAFKGRMFIAHGTADDAVTADHAQRIETWAEHPSLFLLQGSGHTFGAKEPWPHPHMPADLEVLTQKTLHFLSEGRAL